MNEKWQFVDIRVADLTGGGGGGRAGSYLQHICDLYNKPPKRFIRGRWGPLATYYPRSSPMNFLDPPLQMKVKRGIIV